jgi:adenylate kinase
MSSTYFNELFETMVATSREKGDNGPIDLEIKDAELIFKTVWSQLEEKFTRPRLIFPKEIIWLGGAPGAGKGTNTPFIEKERGFTAKPVVVSSLLDSEEAQKIKDSGGMVGDREVVGLLFESLLNSEYENGVIVDGFPRTKVQVECLKRFYHKMIELKNEFHNTPIASRFRYPLFRITVLFVSEKVSVERQLFRGKNAVEEKKQGISDGEEMRATDFSEGLARNRYRTFKERTFDALQSLQNIFHYHFIDAEGTLEEVQWNISKEFQYQSSLELDHDLFEDMRSIPLATEMVIHTRQGLVRRLEEHRSETKELFHNVIDMVANEITPQLWQHSSGGFAIIESKNEILTQEGAIPILIDIMTERGFHLNVSVEETYVPAQLDPKTYAIQCNIEKKYVLRITFRGSEIRRGHD